MRLGRPVSSIVLTADERETLERWARRPTTAQALALRARLVLRCAAGETATAIASGRAPAEAFTEFTEAMVSAAASWLRVPLIALEVIMSCWAAISPASTRDTSEVTSAGVPASCGMPR